MKDECRDKRERGKEREKVWSRREGRKREGEMQRSVKNRS